jgi:chromosome segregation ATPase
MTALFVAILLAVFAGGVCLWLSGMFFGRRPRPDASRRLEEAESRAKKAEETKVRAEEEVGRAATELGRVAGEMSKSEEEIARLKQEVEGLQAAARNRVKPPPLPAKAEAGEKHAEVEESADLDFALAQLDLERSSR